MRDLTNQKFGYLTPIRVHHKTDRGRLYWLCICDCGKTKVMRMDGITRTKCPNCGCKTSELLTKNGKYQKIKTTCNYCNNSIVKYKCQIESGRVYCNSSCACKDLVPSYKGGKIKKECAICKETFFVFKRDIKQKFCSSKCYGVKLSRQRGDETPSWKNAQNYNKIRKSIEYEEWRWDVFTRDNFTCQICGDIGNKLNAHHINNFSEYKNSRLNLDNGVTLCKQCHKKLHHLYGQKVTEKDFIHYQIDAIGSKTELTK